MQRCKTESRFESYLNDFLIGSKKTFSLHEKNATKTVIYNKKKNFGMQYRKQMSDEQIKKLWIFSSISKALKKYVKLNPKFKLHPVVPSVMRNHKLIANLIEGEIFYATDAKHCYWRVTYLENYVSESLYNKLAVQEYKLERNKALACTTSPTKVKDYVRGKLVRERMIGDPAMHNLYTNIRNRSFWIMSKCMEVAQRKSFLKYKTDCIYYLPDKKKEVEDIFRKYGMLFETVQCMYIGNNLFIEHNKKKGDKVNKL